MRMDERAEDRRPRGAVARPLVLLVVAAATGFGVWRLLMDDSASTPEQLSRQAPRIEAAQR